MTHDTNDVGDRFGPCVILRALVETPDGRVDAFVTHLSLSRVARSRTIPEMLDFASRVRDRSSGVGAVLMGDLNAEPDEPSIGEVTCGGWIDAWSSSKGARARGGTWPAIGPRRRIDYIFTRSAERWAVGACWRGSITGSDHLGVVARLDSTRS